MATWPVATWPTPNSAVIATWAMAVNPNRTCPKPNKNPTPNWAKVIRPTANSSDGDNALGHPPPPVGVPPEGDVDQRVAPDLCLRLPLETPAFPVALGRLRSSPVRTGRRLGADPLPTFPACGECHGCNKHNVPGRKALTETARLQRVQRREVFAIRASYVIISTERVCPDRCWTSQ